MLYFLSFQAFVSLVCLMLCEFGCKGHHIWPPNDIIVYLLQLGDTLFDFFVQLSIGLNVSITEIVFSVDH